MGSALQEYRGEEEFGGVAGKFIVRPAKQLRRTFSLPPA
ncbi:hypothetical protein SAMN00790413_04084 [Deinococcus hopiensis KR-140]|uniref:Uncharacterized protein n=1 Tax=Deinococcus hopiensis KR-140 TaxID=695939 RepID=A0A1W1UNF8_9DEIO|nr:hypothetical protein SAMN00790413_04084 [Deinococcus hopiensis KR-140]